MSHAERLAMPLEISGAEAFESDKQALRSGRKPSSLRGRCALALLIGLSLAGYGAIFYFGQTFLVR